MITVIDTENSGAQVDNAAPFNLNNKMCYLGILQEGDISLFSIEYDEEPYGEKLKQSQKIIDRASLAVGFNFKYDLHYLRRYGLSVPCRIFDVQLAWYILTGQQHPYPSLNQVAEYYGVETKLDVVKEQYWEKGLDTPDVPRDLLEEYLAQDLRTTYLCFLKVKEDLESRPIETKRVISVAMQDLVVLAEMEWNGMLYNTRKSLERADEIVRELQDIDNEICRYFGCDSINPNSGDHVSVFLFGGTIKVPCKEEYLFTYKDGRTAVKTRNAIQEVQFERLLEPNKGTALAKDGYYSTSVDNLIVYKEKARGPVKHIIDLLLRRSKIEQQRGTYYHGYPKQIEKRNWKDNIIHTTLNQCVAITGRLSSSKPNMQNTEESVKEMFVTRF